MVLRHAARHRRVREPLVDVDELRVRGGRADRPAAAAAAHTCSPADALLAVAGDTTTDADRQVRGAPAPHAAQRRPAGVQGTDAGEAV